MANDFSSDDDLEDIKHLDVVLDKEDLSVCDTALQYTVTTGLLSPNTCKISDRLANVDKTLLFNSLADKKLQRLQKALTDLLRKCNQQLQELSSCAGVSEKTDSFRHVTSGKPYFRDKLHYTPPDNEDTIIIKRSQMYDFSQVVSVAGWTFNDKTQLLSELLKMSQTLRRNELLSKIVLLQRQKKKDNSVTVQDEIAELNKEICCIKDKSLAELALPIDQEYDWELLANKLNKRHTAQEYESLWKLYLHPNVNKSSWTKNEHLELQRIADYHNLQGWDTIAKELNTKRTGYQCFVYFRTNMSNEFMGRKWSNEEIEYLRRLVEYYREDHYIPWGKVAAAMENRTKIQIYNKYLRLIEIRKGRFLPEEDAVILSCIRNFGINFKEIVNFLPGRSIVQIRNRYSVLTKMRVSTVWSIKEDRILIQLMANQDNNVNFSSLCKFFPGKDRTHIRSRYLTLLKWMKKHPDSDIKSAPRRGARRLIHGLPTDNLQNAIENLRNRMQTEVSVKKNKRITKDSPESDIDDAIVATLLNEISREEEAEEVDNIKPYIYDDSINGCENPNITNLKNLLILFSSSLNMETFKESFYNSKYPGLLNSKDGRIVQVKSYSKKNALQNYELGKLPNIWGDNPLRSVQYVLPPHYSTITGCRVLSNVSSQILSNDYAHINVLLKRNLLLKHHFNILMDRYNILFLWPMLLSCEGPTVAGRGHPSNQQDMTYSQKRASKINFNPPFLTKLRPKKRAKLSHENDQTYLVAACNRNIDKYKDTTNKGIILSKSSNNPGNSKESQ